MTFLTNLRNICKHENIQFKHRMFSNLNNCKILQTIQGERIHTRNSSD